MMSQALNMNLKWTSIYMKYLVICTLLLSLQSRYQSSVKRTTTRKKNTHKKSKKKKNDGKSSAVTFNTAKKMNVKIYVHT